MMTEDRDLYVELLVLREAAAVKRYHTKRTLRTQELSAHSYSVMQLLHHVWPECRKELLLAGMFHDLPEMVTGDVPAPAKRNSPQLATILEEIEAGTGPLNPEFNLSVAEELVLRWADTMELCLWCMEEVIMGNSYCLHTASTGLKWCEDIVVNKVQGRVPFHVVAAMTTVTQRTRRARNEVKEATA
jgi:hypothetical protein